jgi:FkbM family methyltransferase
MSIRSIIVRLARGTLRPLGLSLVRAAPDAFLEQRRLIDKEAITILDVGAHFGMVTGRYKELFPQATVYALEPFPESFLKLQKNTQGYGKVHPINIGLTDRAGLLPLHDNTLSATNSLLDPDEAAEETWGLGTVKSKGTVMCSFDTLDHFTAEKGIEFIDILKLDVQGLESRILDGAEACLASKRIGLIYSEIIIMPTYKGQKPFWEVLRRFDQCGMVLHNIYDLSIVRGRLRQVDAIFISDDRFVMSG